MNYEYSSANGIMNDIKKFSIYHFRLLMQDLELEPDEEFNLDKDLLEVLVFDLFDSQEANVKCEISQILIYLTFNSKLISEFLTDLEYLRKFIELTYSNNWTLVENIIIIIGNIIGNDRKNIDLIIKNLPLIFRLKEMLVLENLSDSNITNLIWLIRIIIEYLKIERYNMVR